jgi:hypothetical protein
LKLKAPKITQRSKNTFLDASNLKFQFRLIILHSL